MPVRLISSLVLGLFILSSGGPQARGIPRLARDDRKGGVERDDGKRGVEALVLGIAQDGGVPHLGCRQPLCVEARRDPSKRRLVASLGLIDHAAGRRFLIDATPDFAFQIDSLGGLPDAILLTHAHIGHYLGLAQLGREVLNAKRVPVYCTRSMARFLRENGPWKRLVALESLRKKKFAADDYVGESEDTLKENLKKTRASVDDLKEEAVNRGRRLVGEARKEGMDFADILLRKGVQIANEWASSLGEPQVKRRRFRLGPVVALLALVGTGLVLVSRR